MKQSILSTKRVMAVAALCMALFSCDDQSAKQPTYDMVYSANGADSAVKIAYVDNNNRTQEFFMDWLLFSNLYNNGGYGNVYGYYHSHPAYFSTPTYHSYSRYHYSPSRVDVYHHDVPARNTSRSTWFNSSSSTRYSQPKVSSSPARSSWFSTPKTSSSPARSSSFSSSSSYKSSYRSSSFSSSRVSSSPSRSSFSSSRVSRSPSSRH